MLLKKLIQQPIIPECGLEPGQCHASTLVALPGGDVLVAWFAGHKEGSDDTAIWLARKQKDTWYCAQKVAAEQGVPHWNPVLFCTEECVWLFYKTGKNVHTWQTRYITSSDAGNTWSQPALLVPQDTRPRGPVKNKVLKTSSGAWLAPGSIENSLHWDAFVDRSEDNGMHWMMSEVPFTHQLPASETGTTLWQGLSNNALWENSLSRVMRWDGVIQPSLWESSPGHIHMLLRSTRGYIYRSDSTDDGKNWCEAYATSLPNNNSGIDLASTHRHSIVLAWNPVCGNWGRRYPLSLSVSTDNGQQWSAPFDIETDEGEYSYPAIICEGNTIHMSYTWNRKNIVYCQLQLMH